MFNNPKVRKFLFTTVVGAGLDFGAKVLEEHQDKTKKREFKSDAFKKTDDDIRKHISETPLQDARKATFEGFDFRKWEVPRPTDRMKLAYKYYQKTDSQQQDQDLFDAGKKILKRKTIEALKKPTKIPEVVRKDVDFAKGVHQGEVDHLRESADSLVSQQRMKVMQGVGLNQMMKAPGYLMPGVGGFLYRSFFNAKTIGNAGREVNKMSKPLEKLDGDIVDVMKKRVEKTDKT